MVFNQALIGIQDTSVYGELKAMVDNALASGNVEKFLRSAANKQHRIRELEAMLGDGVFEKFSVKGEKSPLEVYGGLSASDQGQFREYYLTKIEEIEGRFRAKYKNLFRYS